MKLHFIKVRSQRNLDVGFIQYQDTMLRSTDISNEAGLDYCDVIGIVPKVPKIS